MLGQGAALTLKRSLAFELVMSKDRPCGSQWPLRPFAATPETPHPLPPCQATMCFSAAHQSCAVLSPRLRGRRDPFSQHLRRGEPDPCRGLRLQRRRPQVDPQLRGERLCTLWSELDQEMVDQILLSDLAEHQPVDGQAVQ